MLDLPPDESLPTRPVAVLGAEVRRVNKLAQAARYLPMCRMLPPLLAELHAAAHTAAEADRPVVWGLLAEAVRCAHSVGIAVGRNEMSVAALGWMDRAAEHAGDRAPALRAVREYLRVTATCGSATSMRVSGSTDRASHTWTAPTTPRRTRWSPEDSYTSVRRSSPRTPVTRTGYGTTSPKPHTCPS